MSRFHTKDIPYFYHIELNVSDIQTMTTFYSTVIGLETILTENNRVIMGVANRPFITLYKSKSTQRNQGLYHFAILLQDKQELANVLFHLLSLNYPITGASNHLISQAIYLNDPEGNGIEIAVDVDSSLWPYKNGQLDILYRNKPMNFQEVLEYKSDIPFQGLSSNTILGHIHLHVHDVLKTSDFYKKVLRMNVTIDITPSAMFLSYADYHHHVAMNTWNTYNIENENDENLGLRSLYLHSPNDNFFQIIKNKLVQHTMLFSEDEDSLIFNDPANHQIILTK